MNRAICSGKGPFSMLSRLSRRHLRLGGVLTTVTAGLLSIATGCEGPPGSGEPAQPAVFGCGDDVCSVSQEYCDIVIPADRLPFEDPDVGITRTCRTLPLACVEEASCECLHEETGLGVAEAACNRSLEGGLTLSRRASEPCADAGTAPCPAPAITPQR